ncbi:PREDICTED: uncharacterized protein LOC107190141 [Dufourea novaeangliae]|uniref:uncharacterized protein LOC107190141 n=1 Tax=Dufourea novaeangliae TaxID=178035 RepID=UPI0007673679|nr:PREDICTED: uncharacterized protein LOC107190141 [Dufourea novaeangliae]
MHTVTLCLLAIAGVTCALEIPDISPQLSTVKPIADLGSEINRIINGGNQDNSDERNDNDTARLASELGKQVAQDIENAIRTGASIGTAPFKFGAALRNKLANDIARWLKRVLNQPNNSRLDNTLLNLATQLTNRIAQTVENAVEIKGKILGRFIGLTALTKAKLIQDVTDWITQTVQPAIPDVYLQLGPLICYNGSCAFQRTTTAPSRSTSSTTTTQSSTNPSTSDASTTKTTTTTPENQSSSESSSTKQTASPRNRRGVEDDVSNILG